MIDYTCVGRLIDQFPFEAAEQYTNTTLTTAEVQKELHDQACSFLESDRTEWVCEAPLTSLLVMRKVEDGAKKELQLTLELCFAGVPIE